MSDRYERDYDVAVVGGGPAGSVAARTLSSRGRTVLLLEQTSYEGWRIGETLPPAIRPILTALGVGERFDELELIPSPGTRSLWGGKEVRSRSFIRHPHTRGWHVCRRAFDRMLADAAVEAGARLYRGVRMSECEAESGDGFTLTLDTGASLAAGQAHDPGGAPEHPAEPEKPLNPRVDHGSVPTTVQVRGVVDAGGRKPAVAGALGGRRDLRDRLVAAAARVRIALETCGRHTLVEARPEGWWYSAPIPDGEAVVMWVTDADLLESRHDAGPWREALADSERTAARMQDAPVVEGPIVSAAVSQRLRRPKYDRRWLSVGDAALAVDPLSGEGIQRAVDTGVRGALAMDRWLAGEGEAARSYGRKLDAAFRTYLERRREVYTREARWSDRPFWRRRRDRSGRS